jgi:hypothetical protein
MRTEKMPIRSLVRKNHAMKRLFVSCALIFAIASQGLAYGGEGHKAIAKAASGFLKGKGLTGVQNVLGTTDLASIATWPDDLKQAARGKGPLVNDPEAIKFNHDFPKNGSWHFVNLPLGMQIYADNGPFSDRNDIVHAINGCISILEGKVTPNFSKRQALRFLVHLVGDIHQPLHVGTGYYQFDANDHATLIKDPNAALGKTDDVGGNDLFFASGKELHAFWDTGLVEQLAGIDFQQLATFLSSKMNSTWMNSHQADWNTPGDYHMWAERWASDSVHAANEVYAGVTFGDATFDTHQRLQRINIILGPSGQGYASAHIDRETVQMVEASTHLAQLPIASNGSNLSAYFREAAGILATNFRRKPSSLLNRDGYLIHGDGTIQSGSVRTRASSESIK